MDATLLGPLAVLALIDSTSFGTLLIPVWLLLHPGRVRASRMFVFLGTVAAFYGTLGLALATGAGAALPALERVLQHREVLWGQLVVGVGLVVLSFRMDRRGGKNAAAPADGGEHGGGRPGGGRLGGGRLERWRQRVMDEGGLAGLVGLALTATAVEVGTMLPYLAAIGLVAAADLSLPQVGGILTGYCLLMIAPALVLLALRAGLGQRVQPLLQRLSNWLTSSNALAWVVGIVGFLLARDAAARLGVLEHWGAA